MIAAVPQIVTEAAGFLVAIAAGCTAIGVLGKLPPVRWLVRKAMIEPAETWALRLIDAVVSRLTDALDDLRERVERIEGTGDETLHRVTYHLGSNDTTTPIHARVSRLEVAHGLEPVEQQEEHRHDQ